MQGLSNFSFVLKLEHLLQSLYGYFSPSPSKGHADFQKLAECVQKEVLKISRNNKPRCINMLEPIKKMGNEYKTLLAKNHVR
jgi:hypothetical protein